MNEINAALELVAVTSKRGTRTRVRVISDDSHHASTRTVCVVRVVSTAGSRTEKLCILSHSYLPYPAIVDVSRLSKEINAALE